MTHSTRLTIVTGVIAVVLLLSGCPSPVNIFTGNSTTDSDLSPESDETPVYETTAEVTFDAQRGIVVFIEEDGTETPVVVSVDGEEDGPVELIAYSILDDGGVTTSRSSRTSNRIRAIVVGRRRDGRSGVWAIYRYGGVMVLPNEDGDQSSALMELVEFEGSPYLGDEWVYEATAIKDGKIIIGKLHRPDGWEYLGSDAPDPTIGVFWSICETDENLYISRARPILLMHEPEPEDAFSRRSWLSEWLDMLIEWLQATFLELSWNYLGSAERFVPDAEVVKGGFEAPPEGTYVVEGEDKHGITAWAWLTYKSVENIVDAPEAPPVKNNPPYPPIEPEYEAWLNAIMLPEEVSFSLFIDFSDPADPDPKDVVKMEIVSFYMTDFAGTDQGPADQELLDDLNIRFSDTVANELLLNGLSLSAYDDQRIAVEIRTYDNHGAVSDTIAVRFYLNFSS